MSDVLRFAVIGEPVGHSRSPAMHAAAYAALGLPHVYVALPTSEAELPERVRALRAGELAGINVTVPHKRRVLDFVDAVDMSAGAVGAANTLVRDSLGKIVAFNTDVPALAAELRKLAAASRPAASWGEGAAVVCGSGGAARAAVVALAVLGVRTIRVRARNPERASDLPAILARAGSDTSVIVEPLAPGDRDDRVLTVVQATSAGMAGVGDGESVAAALDWQRLPPEAVALDLVYAPPETPFVRAARAAGVRAENGLGMLAGQGALAFGLWLGTEAPFEPMRRALELGEVSA